MDQISELESEKQHLSDAVASLQERAQSNNEARVREVEAQNRLLHQNITDTSSRLASLETQLKLANEEAARMSERAGRCEEVEREAARLERSRDALNREVLKLMHALFFFFFFLQFRQNPPYANWINKQVLALFPRWLLCRHAASGQRL